MKKAITILAVLIVLASAVFAAETHKIQIKSVVDPVYPVFQWVFVSGTGSNVEANTVFTNDGEVEDTDTSYEIDCENAILLSSIAEDSLTVVFDARLLTDVKLARRAVYDLQFVAEPLVGEAQSYSVSPVLQGSSVSYDVTGKASRTTAETSYYEQHPEFPAFITKDTDLASVPVTPADASAKEAGETPYAEKLTQTTKVAFETENVTKGNLARFTVVYPQDTAAPADTYRAYISMNITAH